MTPPPPTVVAYISCPTCRAVHPLRDSCPRCVAPEAPARRLWPAVLLAGLVSAALWYGLVRAGMGVWQWLGG